ncbi:MAG TPA: AbrB family transcriptional regulator [Desulfotomaculum sp.]|jgi:AbrB family looped-hinge helix DNA binding protein|nr:AbrB family transcriptional regulator [Desulfotomaculum sp.]
MSIVKLSSKRQITLPAKVCREINLKQGDHLILEVKGNQITFTCLPENFTDFLAGKAKGVYGKSSKNIDEYVQKERETWE